MSMGMLSTVSLSVDGNISVQYLDLLVRFNTVIPNIQVGIHMDDLAPLVF